MYAIRILPHPEVAVEITVVVGSTQEELNTLQHGNVEEEEPKQPVAQEALEEEEIEKKTKVTKKKKTEEMTETD